MNGLRNVTAISIVLMQQRFSARVPQHNHGMFVTSQCMPPGWHEKRLAAQLHCAAAQRYW
jgi:hypothetical protein